MATDERQECLACTHLRRPVCDGSGVLLTRGAVGGVVFVQVCPRWPASWDEPAAYFEALARHGSNAVPVSPAPEKIWPAVQAELAHTPHLPADGTPAVGQDSADADRETVGGMRIVALVALAALVVVVALVVAVALP